MTFSEDDDHNLINLHNDPMVVELKVVSTPI